MSKWSLIERIWSASCAQYGEAVKSICNIIPIFSILQKNEEFFRILLPFSTEVSHIFDNYLLDMNITQKHRIQVGRYGRDSNTVLNVMDPWYSCKNDMKMKCSPHYYYKTNFQIDFQLSVDTDYMTTHQKLCFFSNFAENISFMRKIKEKRFRNVMFAMWFKLLHSNGLIWQVSSWQTLLIVSFGGKTHQGHCDRRINYDA